VRTTAKPADKRVRQTVRLDNSAKKVNNKF